MSINASNTTVVHRSWDIQSQLRSVVFVHGGLVATLSTLVIPCFIGQSVHIHSHNESYKIALLWGTIFLAGDSTQKLARFEELLVQQLELASSPQCLPINVYTRLVAKFIIMDFGSPESPSIPRLAHKVQGDC